MFGMKAHETFKYQQLLAKCCSETEVNMKHEHSRLGMTATAASEVVTCEAKSFSCDTLCGLRSGTREAKARFGLKMLRLNAGHVFPL